MVLSDRMLLGGATVLMTTGAVGAGVHGWSDVPSQIEAGQRYDEKVAGLAGVEAHRFMQSHRRPEIFEQQLNWSKGLIGGSLLGGVAARLATKHAGAGTQTAAAYAIAGAFLLGVGGFLGWGAGLVSYEATH